MASRNWSDIGIMFVQDTIARGTGADRVEFRTKAEIPQPSDWDVFVEHFGKPSVLEMLKASNSLRVGAQAVCRDILTKNASATQEEMREAVYGWMKGQRARGTTTVTVTVHNRYLLDGSLFDGTDETEWRQANVAFLVSELGMDVDKAITKANGMEWKA